MCHTDVQLCIDYWSNLTGLHISADLFMFLHFTNICRFVIFFLLSLLFLVTDFCSSFNRRVKVALLGLTLQAKHLMHIFPKALLKWQLFMSTGRNLINKRSPLCIYHFDSMLSLAQNLISFFVLLLLKLLRFSLYMQRRINIPYLSEPVKLYMCLLLVSSLKELMGDRCWILWNILIAPLKRFVFPTISLNTFQSNLNDPNL